MHATSARATRLNANDECQCYDGAIELHDGECGREVAVDSSVLEGLVGWSPEALAAGLASEDKAARKGAKAAARAATAHLQGLSGVFLLGAGPSGLTVHGLPPRS